MKTKEELNALKEEVETLNRKLAELSDDTLDNVIGGLGSSETILRTLKEKVINAANDTNTDVDRAAIQKELNASIAQIDENALLTFNGKIPNNSGQN